MDDSRRIIQKLKKNSFCYKSKDRNMKAFIFIGILALTYLVFIFSGYASLETKHSKYEIKYEGLLWVVLDYWSIWKYNSSDKPMKWITFNKQNVQ